MNQIIDTCPAYDVIAAPNKIDICEMEIAIDMFKAGDTIAIAFESRNHGTLRRMYKFGSVVSYAAEYNECPIQSVEDTKRNMIESPYAGHKLHWLNQQSVMITSEKRARRTYFNADFGDVVFFEGRNFRITKTSNNNADLVEVYAEESETGYNWMAK